MEILKMALLMKPCTNAYNMGARDLSEHVQILSHLKKERQKDKAAWARLASATSAALNGHTGD